ncbi:MAG: hypothetical protein QOD99_108, partial [Chthoniobacter sp.]|nr:hypothetical protein [Chthoniobacter sp.]
MLVGAEIAGKKRGRRSASRSPSSFSSFAQVSSEPLGRCVEQCKTTVESGHGRSVSVAVSVVQKALRPILKALDLIPPDIQNEENWRNVRRPLVNYLERLEWLETHAHWEHAGGSAGVASGARRGRTDPSVRRGMPGKGGGEPRGEAVAPATGRSACVGKLDVAAEHPETLSPEFD